MLRLGVGSLIERKEEIGGKREKAGIRFNSTYERSMTYKGQPLIIFDTSSLQGLHVYLHHKYSGFERQSSCLART